MKKHLILLLFLLPVFAEAQVNGKYQDIDALIGTGSMIDAMTAIRMLKENHVKDTSDAEYWLRYSKAAGIYYKDAEAKSAIDQAIKLKPTNPEYYFEKGFLLNRISETENALQPLNKAIALKKEGKYFYWRGIVHQQLKHDTLAEKDYLEALSLKFENAEMNNNLAILLSENGKYSEALRIINRAILLKPDYAQAYSARSKIRFFLLDIDSSCVDMEKAHDLGYRKTFPVPDSVCSANESKKLRYAAEFLSGYGYYKAGIAAFTKLLEKEQQSDFYLNRGYSYFKLKDYVNAEKDYIKALSLPKPATDLLYDNLSLLYYELGNYEKSIEYSSKRIELNPKNHVPYIDRGLCYRKLKKYKEAEKDYNRSLEIKPDFFRAYGYRASLETEMGLYEKAIVDANKAIELRPDYGFAYMAMAEAKINLKQADFCYDLYNARKYGEEKAEAAIKEYCK